MMISAADCALSTGDFFWCQEPHSAETDVGIKRLKHQLRMNHDRAQLGILSPNGCLVTVT